MKLQFIAAAVIAACTLPAQASLINSAGSLLNPSNTVDFEAFDGLVTDGPVSIAPGVTFTANIDAELGAYIRDLNENGVWGLGNHFAAAGSAGMLTFAFADLQSGVGAFVNHFRDVNGGSITVAAFDSSDTLLEEYTWDLSTDVYSYNEGAFTGISRNVADIRSVVFSGMGAVADNLTYTSAVPEPAGLALSLCGLSALVGSRLTRRRQSH